MGYNFDGAVWSGLLSGAAADGDFEPFTAHNKEIAGLLGLPHYAQLRGFENAEDVAREIVKRHRASATKKPIILYGHSNGGRAALIAGRILHDAGISHTLLIADLTMKSSPPVSRSAKIVRHFEGVLSTVSAFNNLRFDDGWDGDFKQILVLASHVSIPENEKVIAEIRAVANRLSSAPTEEDPFMPTISIPPQAARLHRQLETILDPSRESPARTAFYKAFTDEIRGPVFSGRIGGDAFDGLKRLLFLWDAHFSQMPDAWLAFILQQIGRETGLRFRPVRETFADSDAEAIRRLEAAWNAGRLPTVRTPYWRDGEFGRGDIQVTHAENRMKLDSAFQKSLGWRPGFSDDRDRLLDPVLSGLAAMVGCIEGVFRGRALKDYSFPDDFAAARDIVNGDTASGKDVADANAFLAAIEKGREAAQMTGGVPAPVDPSNPLPGAPAPNVDVLTPEAIAGLSADELMDLIRRADVLRDAAMDALEARIAELKSNQARQAAVPNEAKGNDMKTDAVKRWWESLGVNGGLTALISMVLVISGYDAPVETATELGNKLVEIIGLIGALAGIYGRLRATKRIG